MKDTLIIERRKRGKKLRKAVLLTGLPGIGLIGQVVGRYLMEQLKAEKIAILLSPHFPHQVFMTKKGSMRLIRNSIYLHKGKKRDIVILLGDVQAMSSAGQYEVADKILVFCKELGVEEIITVGGYSTGKFSEQRRILAVTSVPDLQPKLKSLGVVFGEAKGSIVGAAGLLPALSKLHGLKGVCLMGETHGGYVDTASARSIVQLLSKYLGVPISLKKLDERVAESQKVIKKVEEDIQKSMSEQFEATNKNVSYIR